jgi:hypothetical protein
MNLPDRKRTDHAKAVRRERHALVSALRRVLGLSGAVLLGGALAWAPIAAFTGEMLLVTKVGLTGVAFLLVMKLLPRRDPAAERHPDSGEES